MLCVRVVKEVLVFLLYHKSLTVATFLKTPKKEKRSIYPPYMEESLQKEKLTT